MACDRYLPFVVTATGLNVADPVGLVSTTYDYNEWHDLAWKFIEIYEENLDKFFAAGAQDAHWANALESYKKKYADMPFVYMIFGIPAAPGAEDGDILTARNLTVAVAKKICQLEVSMAAQGITADIPFDVESPPAKAVDLGAAMEKAAGAAGGLLTLAIIVMLLRNRK